MTPSVRNKSPDTKPTDVGVDSYLAEWTALSPAQRLRRSWRLRRRIKDLGAVHDAKTFPEL